jgi:hypothetical protein
VPSLKAWLRIEPHSERYVQPASAEMGEQCEAYYFHHYMRHFGEGPVGHAYRSIPQARARAPPSGYILTSELPGSCSHAG